MKIEKLNENQIKFILSQSDLSDRNIKLDEIAYGSEKTQDLFREMMEQAVSEFGFYTDNIPLMIEAVPIALDSIMIIVTKVNNPECVVDENKFKITSTAREMRRLKRKLSSQSRNGASDKLFIYSFRSLDDAALLSARLSDVFLGQSYLYRLDNQYYLVLQNDNTDDKKALERIENILSEYGEKHISTVLSKHYLIEHGDILIQNEAVNMLSKHLA